MYAGRKVEEAPVEELFLEPRHPYTIGLLGSVPRVDRAVAAQSARLAEIPGMVPSPSETIIGLPLRAALPAGKRTVPRSRPAARANRARPLRRVLAFGPGDGIGLA